VAAKTTETPPVRPSAGSSTSVGIPAGVDGGAAAPMGAVQLARFCDVAVERDFGLVFQVRPLLAPELTPPQVFWGKLGIISPPTVEVS
jgi:hypothetical protein